MNKCETCKHRGDDHLETFKYHPDTYEDIPVTYYECKRVAHGNGGFGEENYKPGERALAVDGSGYRAMLVVENDFGCVLWEAKR